MTMSIDSKQRLEVTAVYSKHKSVRKMGYWHSNYIFTDVKDLNGNLLVDRIQVGDAQCIKRQGFKQGDIVKMTITLQEENGKVRALRPANACVVDTVNDNL